MDTLLCQPLSAANVRDLYLLSIDPHIRRYLLDGELVSMEWALAELSKSQALFDEGIPGLWLLSDGSSFIGFCGLRIFDELGAEPQLIYALLEQFTGRGLASRAAQWVIHQAKEAGMDQVTAIIDAPNVASIKVAKKLGMVEVGALPGEFGPMPVFMLPLSERAKTQLAELQRPHEHKLVIARSFDGAPIEDEQAHAHVTLRFTGECLLIEVDAPFYDDPRPNTPAGATPHLWEFEVVEVFFLGAQERYLELELGPHGHHLALSLRGRRKIEAMGFDLFFKHELKDTRWRGQALVPLSWLPAGFNQLNAYAIHGQGDKRRYLSSFGAPTNAPDFHHLESFATLIAPLP